MAATDSTGDGRVTNGNPPSSDRHKRAPERREALLDAAEIVVRRVGPQVTAAQIAAEAGVTKPIIYRHFGDIHDLYQALAMRMERRLSNWLIQARIGTASLDQRGRLQAVIGAFFDAVRARAEAVSVPRLHRWRMIPGRPARSPGSPANGRGASRATWRCCAARPRCRQRPGPPATRCAAPSRTRPAGGSRTARCRSRRLSTRWSRCCWPGFRPTCCGRPTSIPATGRRREVP